MKTWRQETRLGVEMGMAGSPGVGDQDRGEQGTVWAEWGQGLT